MKILWILTAISSAIGGLVGFIAFMAASTGLQEASAAAAAVASAVIPFCFTRAIQEAKKFFYTST